MSVCIAEVNILNLHSKGMFGPLFKGRIPASEINGLLKTLNKFCLKSVPYFSSLFL